MAGGGRWVAGEGGVIGTRAMAYLYSRIVRHGAGLPHLGEAVGGSGCSSYLHRSPTTARSAPLVERGRLLIANHALP